MQEEDESGTEYKCAYYGNHHCKKGMLDDAIELLKEQAEEIENLKQTAQSMMEGICLLKEQEAVVRCKDCTFRNETNCPLYYWRSELTDNWFCADGEREET